MPFRRPSLLSLGRCRNSRVFRRADVDLRPGQGAAIYRLVLGWLAGQCHVDNTLCGTSAYFLKQFGAQRIKRHPTGRKRNFSSFGTRASCRKRIKPVIGWQGARRSNWAGVFR